jgi:hypothetical protein
MMSGAPERADFIEKLNALHLAVMIMMIMGRL